MVALESEANLTINREDMCRILTDALCPYGSFSGLQVVIVSENKDKGFDLVLNPKPPAVKAVKAA